MYRILLWWTGIISVTSQVFVSRTLSKSSKSACFDKTKRGFGNFQHVNVLNISWFSNDICKRGDNNHNRVRIMKIIPRNKTSFTFRELYVCFPNDFHRGRLIFNAVILKSKPSLSVTSLCKPHDILTIYKNPRKATYVLLRMHQDSQLEILYSPQIQQTRTKAVVSPSLRAGHQRDVQMLKRHVYSPANYTSKSNIIDASKCGSERGCYRDGESSCQHFECNYFISYWTNNKIADIELSGKSNGWVAIGFSSDKKMGTDEVFACAYANDGKYISVGSYKNIHHHVRPEPVNNFAVLKHSESRNGYMYCRFEVPVKREDSSVDLTNEWTQFYAHGGIKGGIMEKHSDRPLISETQISIVQHPNIINCASLILTFEVFYVLSIIVAFII